MRNPPAMMSATSAATTRSQAPTLKRKTHREVDRSRRVAGTRIEIMSVFQADGTEDRFPPKSCTCREKRFVQWIVVQIAGKANRIGEDHHGKGAGESLLEFDVAEHVGFRADELAGR